MGSLVKKMERGFSRIKPIKRSCEKRFTYAIYASIIAVSLLIL